MPLFGVDRVGGRRVEPTKIGLFETSVVDFDCYTDEDGHEYYQHWIGIGDKLYKSDSSILRADGKTEKPNRNSIELTRIITEYGDLFKDIINKSDYIVIDATSNNLIINCIKGDCIYALSPQGTFILEQWGEHKFQQRFDSEVECSYRYEIQYNNYINKILGININE